MRKVKSSPSEIIRNRRSYFASFSFRGRKYFLPFPLFCVWHHLGLLFMDDVRAEPGDLFLSLITRIFTEKSVNIRAICGAYLCSA